MSASEVEHQPRERAVACGRCGAQTWEIAALCQRCQAVGDEWGRTAARLRIERANARTHFNNLDAALDAATEARNEAWNAWSEADTALTEFLRGE